MEIDVAVDGEKVEFVNGDAQSGGVKETTQGDQSSSALQLTRTRPRYPQVRLPLPSPLPAPLAPRRSLWHHAPPPTADRWQRRKSQMGPAKEHDSGRIAGSEGWHWPHGAEGWEGRKKGRRSRGCGIGSPSKIGNRQDVGLRESVP